MYVARDLGGTDWAVATGTVRSAGMGACMTGSGGRGSNSGSAMGSAGTISSGGVGSSPSSSGIDSGLDSASGGGGKSSGGGGDSGGSTVGDGVCLRPGGRPDVLSTRVVELPRRARSDLGRRGPRTDRRLWVGRPGDLHEDAARRAQPFGPVLGKLQLSAAVRAAIRHELRWLRRRLWS